jgi:protoporphyrinogen IX oxidase
MEWVKVLHILCVMGWMTGVFAAPRALIFWKREYDRMGEFGPTGDLTVRIYRFSMGLGVIAIISGLWMAVQWQFPSWVVWKLILVIAMAVHYGYTGSLVLKAKQGIFPHSDKFLRIFNELSVLVAIGVLILVVYKP